jgi:D-alanyl-D-alanine carboxypeptidase (penicillin-binding protein 5/6)
MRAIKIIGVIFMIGLIAAAALMYQVRFEDYLYAQISAPLENMVIVAPAPKSLESELNLVARSALSLRINSAGREKVIFAKDKDEVLPIASITKLMAALIVLQNPVKYNLNQTIIISKTAASQDDVPVFGNLKTGEIYTTKDLLNLMMYYSSNDAAYALAEVVGAGKFVSLMNEEAQELGLSSTNFTNPSGLDGTGKNLNVSSAADLVALARHIAKNQPQIFDFSIMPGPFASENGIFNVNLWDGQKLVGGKTGYTEVAGGCMLLIFTDSHNRHYFNVILGALSPENRVIEMQKLVNYDNNVSGQHK